MAGEGDAAVLDGAGVEEVEEDALAFLDADGFAGAEGLVVDGVGHGVDLEAVGGGVEDGGLLELRVVLALLVGVVHVGGEEGLPVAEGEEDLLIVLAGVVAGVDVKEAELAGVGAFVEVGIGHGVGVVPAGAGGARGELIAAAALWRDEGCGFLFDPVDFGGDEQAVPVDEFGDVGGVDDVDGDGLALAHAQDGAGRGAVVADGAEDAFGGELDGDGGDAEGVVGFAFGGGCGVRGLGDHLPASGRAGAGLLLPGLG